jgi:hypothetical protein
MSRDERTAAVSGPQAFPPQRGVGEAGFTVIHYETVMGVGSRSELAENGAEIIAGIGVIC